MFSIWAKAIKEDKLIKNSLISFEDKFKNEDFHEYVFYICNELDIPSPIILSKHIRHFVTFNNASFKPEDFVEEINFDKLVLEYCKEQEKTPNQSNF